ncbi:hypothetical protein MSG28_015323 [Choristoneura fumiferana]|uniref:Uncharacterized protein n=1 Tax=Choristoneura fumiferana TaxID=7141 RepID=A0ACC0KAF9_CHOFU|nr:hypothetical protein MSG28_015323 [Choristoneura fumiferana]
MSQSQANVKRPDCKIECSPDRCCLQIEGEENCDVLDIMGGCYETVPAGSTRTVRLAAPLMYPFQRRGYCIVYLDTRPEERGVIRYTVRIDFDTTALASGLPDDSKPCDTIDQDPLNNCKPVDCDIRYNGHKPHFHPRLRRCVEAPPCLPTNLKSPDVLYDENSNRCLKNTSLSDDDLSYIKSLSNGRIRNAKDIIIIKNKPSIFNSTAPNDGQYADNDDEPNGTRSLVAQPVDTCPAKTKVEEPKPTISYKISDYFETYKDTLKVLAVVVFMQCCLICTMLYLLAKTCHCDKEKPLVSRFFNYRHDVSVTTPLIDTSDHDTETTYHYLSDSTNVDKKIKCYKACHKNRTRSARLSMSDDILAKCVTRRDWKQRSDVIPEHKPEEWLSDDKNQDRVKRTDTKINFENEVRKSKSDIKSKASKGIIKRKSENIDVEPSSEQEITCHMYSYDNCEKNSIKKTISLSSEKGAQACFSNDSIDDFLSERGMIFLAGENISKYTFSSDSTYNLHIKNSCSEISSKTSKNNIVQNVLSLLQRKQHGPASDPGGGQKSTDNLNLELLHMSQASVFTSTNESECVGGFKRTMDSRTSL